MVVEEAGAVGEPGRRPQQRPVEVVLHDRQRLAADGRHDEDVRSADPLSGAAPEAADRELGTIGRPGSVAGDADWRHHGDGLLCSGGYVGEHHARAVRGDDRADRTDRQIAWRDEAVLAVRRTGNENGNEYGGSDGPHPPAPSPARRGGVGASSPLSAPERGRG
jgi:hypothetical protein